MRQRLSRGEAHRMAFAGRTDAGVHATGQVAATTTTSALPLRRWIEGLNHFLPTAVAVQAAREVPLAFDPRRNAVERTYQYRIRLSRTRQPLWERQAWVKRGSIALAPIREALVVLEGRHDFAALRRSPSGRIRCVRCMKLGWMQCHGGSASVSGPRVFLTYQVRRMVGLLMRAGHEDEAPESVRRLLEVPHAGTVRPSAPPQGLVLAQVRYQLAVLADWDNGDENVCGPES